MRKTMLAVLLLTFALAAPAMTKEQAIKAVAQANSTLSTLESDFAQEKLIKMMNRTVPSAGRLYFDRTGKLNMTYSTPEGNVILINGDDFIVRNGKRTNRFDTRKNDGMRLLRNALLNSFKGDVQAIADENSAQISYSQQDGLHVFTVTAADKRQLYNGFIIRYDSRTMRLSSLTITEATGNSTDYTLTGEPRLNHSLDNGLFNVKLKP